MKISFLPSRSCAGIVILGFFTTFGTSQSFGAPVISMDSSGAAVPSIPDHGLLHPPDEVLRAARIVPKTPIAPPVPDLSQPDRELSFSATPTDNELILARGFEVLLAPQSNAAVRGENAALGETLLRYRRDPEDLSPLLTFLDEYPDSRWKASLLLNIGLIYQHQGRWSKVIPAWEEAWSLSKNDSSNSIRAIADRTIGELVQIHARLGHSDRLKELLDETKTRDVRGAGTEGVVGARQGLWLMQNQPQEAFRCGPLALAHLYQIKFPGQPIPDKIDGFKSTSSGTNLSEIHAWATQLNLGFQMAYRNVGAKVVVPSVINWKVGHFAALSQGPKGNYISRDSTFGYDNMVSADVIDSEASGYFLVPEGRLPLGWRTVSDEEAQRIFGKGDGGPPPDSPPPDDETDVGGDSDPDDPCGMTTYRFDAASVSLLLTDTPVGYAPPVGPAIRFTANYNHREASGNSSVSNLGDKWSFDWLSYIQVKSGATVCFGPGGGQLPFTFIASSNSFAPQLLTQDQLVQLSSSGYELDHKDGSKDIYDLSTGGAQPFIFRTSSIDRNGNSVNYGYDGNFRLITVRDAIHQTTVLSYGLDTNPANAAFYFVSAVTDPFGRAATFTYNNLGQLVTITDVLGITSAFAYGTGSFVSSLTTPYGVTTFTSGDFQAPSYTRWLQAKDPLGGQERIEWDQLIYPPFSDVLDSFQSNLAPPGFTNSNLVYRNTFFWGKKAMLVAPGDYNKAFIFHWLHDAASGNAKTGYVVESTKEPLENRVWKAYANQPSTLLEGASNLPSMVSRVLDDGTIQNFQYQYNVLGHLTQAIDPVGRKQMFQYAGNNIDLQTVLVQNGPVQEVNASFTYDSHHNIITSTDASGEVSSYTYNSFGEILSVTNPKSETTTFAYDLNGYLQSVTGPIAGATTTFTYDAFGRAKTVTDSEGYTLTNDYDAADRLIRKTFPDGTFTQRIYDRLDTKWTEDRLGRWKLTEHDALRHLIVSEDPLLRKTYFEYCPCGALVAITDPNGSRTQLNRDLQNRVTQKVFADGTNQNIAYEATTSRRKTFTDAIGQIKTFSYNPDNTVQGIAYTNAVVATASCVFNYDSSYPRLSAMVNGVGTISYNYNPVGPIQSLGAGRLASISGPLQNSSVSFSYDELGRTVGTSVNGSANPSSIAYDALGRVTTATNLLGQFAYQYVDQTARLRSLAYPNGQIANFTYFPNTTADGSGNEDQRLQAIQNLNANSSNLSTFAYTYDPAGEISTWSKQLDARASQASTFSYDAGSQLLSARVSNLMTQQLQGFYYTYDSAENRIQEQVDAGINTSGFSSTNEYLNENGGGSMAFAGSINEPANMTVGGNPASVDVLNNWSGAAEVTQGANVIPLVATDASGGSTSKSIHVTVGTGPNRTLTYDSNGNLTNNGSGQTYQWDAENRLVGIVQASGTTGFVYDGAGHRVQETLNGTLIKQWVWRGSQPCEERDSSGNVTKSFYPQGEQIAGATYFFTKDHLGSVRELTDGSGAIRARYEYDPYGRVKKMSGDLDADFGFTGDYFHKASGLSLTLYRAYDPNLGRWLSRDPLGEAGGLNLYGYVGNNPISSIDPRGTDTTTLSIAGAASLGAGASGGYAAIMASLNVAIASNPVGWGAGALALGYAAGTALDNITGFSTAIANGYNAPNYSASESCPATPRKPSKQIRKEWEEANDEPWPTDPETGNNQDVSHKKPLADGGTNELDNIEPLTHEDHVQQHKDAGDFKRWGSKGAPAAPPDD